MARIGSLCGGRVPDSLENRAYFGGHHNATEGNPQRNESGYPLLRVVALMALRFQLIAAAQFGPYRHQDSAAQTGARDLSSSGKTQNEQIRVKASPLTRRTN